MFTLIGRNAWDISYTMYKHEVYPRYQMKKSSLFWVLGIPMIFLTTLRTFQFQINECKYFRVPSIEYSMTSPEYRVWKSSLVIFVHFEYRVSSTVRRVPSIKILIISEYRVWYFSLSYFNLIIIPSTRYLILDTWYSILDTRYLILDTRYSDFEYKLIKTLSR